MHSDRKVPQLDPDMLEPAPGKRIYAHLFRPEDAPGIGRLFHTVYGDNYPVKLYYSPEALAEALETGEGYSIAARTENGEIIGHVALSRSPRYSGLYECVAGLVLPEYRNAGVSRLLMNYAYERLPPALGLEEVWGEAVCNHVYMQKNCLRYKHVETGIEVDLMPAETYAKEESASGRVASVLVFRSYVPRPHTVYLPPFHENILKFLYSGLDDRRTFEAGRGRPPAGSSSLASSEVYELPRVARTTVQTIGEDFGPYFDGLECGLFAKRIKVSQVWVNLACPWVGYAVDALRDRGYFMGGILPRWFDDDGLLMQKIIGRPDWEGIHLFSDRAAEILRIIRKDREEVLSNLGAK